MNKEIEQDIKNIISNNKHITNKYHLIDKIIDEFKKLNKYTEELENILHNSFDVKYSLNLKKLKFNNNKIITIPSKYIKSHQRVEYLKSIPQPEQKSKAWFDMRNQMITASDIGSVLGVGKYGSSNSVLLKKCGFDKFLDNKFVHHGKKYEQIATLIYSLVLNTTVDEFGLIQSEKYSFLGASPDGICSHLTLDGKFCKLVGRMLEIKCPFSRQLELLGPVYDTVCPAGYWVQIQIQLEVCELDECDYLQCEITEYPSRKEYLLDQNSSIIYIGNNVDGNVTENVEYNFIYNKGVVIQLLPHNRPFFKKDVFDAKYIYPPNVNMNHLEYDEWVLHELDNLDKNYPDYRFDKVLYWKLEKANVITIKRDTEWFKKHIPEIEKFWKDVLYYRKNTHELKQPKEKKVEPEFQFLSDTDEE